MRYLAGLLVLLAVAVVALEAEKSPPAQPINVNAAGVVELQQLPGVGPAMAKAIVHYRERNGRFRRLEELLIIRGMSRAKLRRLRPHLRLDAPAPVR